MAQDRTVVEICGAVSLLRYHETVWRNMVADRVG
jgi:hypothetical protein